jgi:hypothetical protein
MGWREAQGSRAWSLDGGAIDQDRPGFGPLRILVHFAFPRNAGREDRDRQYAALVDHARGTGGRDI